MFLSFRSTGPYQRPALRKDLYPIRAGKSDDETSISSASSKLPKLELAGAAQEKPQFSGHDQDGGP